MGKRENVLDAQANCLQEQMTYRTRAEAWVFAKGLLQEVATELNTLKADVGRMASTITEAVGLFDAALSERCKEADRDERAQLQQQLVRFYRPQEVINFAHELTRDHPLQNQQVNGVRLALIGQLGDSPTFGAFNARISRQMFLDTLERHCERAAIEAHNNVFAANRDRVRLLGVNIVDQLAREYSGRTEPLKKFITDLVKAAGNYVTFEPTEVGKTARGVLNAPTRLHSFTVILPKSAENPEFMVTLTDIFRGASESDVTVIQNDRKRNEITLISIVNLFPLRFLRPVGMLRQRYERRIENAGTRARLEVHIEGDGRDLPSLFVPDEQTLRAEGLSYLILATCMGIVERTQDGAGRNQLRLLTKDADGFDNAPVLLGATLLEAVDQMDETNFDLIKTAVLDGVNRDVCDDKSRTLLRNEILAQVEAFKSQECRGDAGDPRYVKVVAAGRAAMKLAVAPS
jgi:hypothetical protein